MNAISHLKRTLGLKLEQLADAQDRHREALQDHRAILVELHHSKEDSLRRFNCLHMSVTCSLSQLRGLSSATLTNARDGLVKVSMEVTEMLHVCDEEGEIPGLEEAKETIMCQIKDVESGVLAQPIPPKPAPACGAPAQPANPWD